MSDQSKQDDRKAAAQKKRAVQLQRVVCICKGIPLRKVLPAVQRSTTIAEVNRRAGTGQGGCQGRRCGPRIKTLLSKAKAQRLSKK